MARGPLGMDEILESVGELRHGQLAILDRIRETVRLAEGLSENGDISPDARRRALDCLSRFGERLRDMHANNVRAAGTSTIRRAREDSTFMVEAEAALKHARASVVRVRLWQEGELIRLLIEDNGIGFDPAAAPPRQGRPRPTSTWPRWMRRLSRRSRSVAVIMPSG